MNETIIWKVGARVQRHVDVHDRTSELLHGVVVAREFHDNKHRHVYTVRWDGQQEPHTGYFWWGLDVEVPNDVLRAAIEEKLR